MYLFLVIVTSMMTYVMAGKVLIFFVPGSGSMSEQLAIADGLLEYGHEVHAVVSEDFHSHPMMKKFKDIKIHYHREQPGANYDIEKFGEDLINYAIEENRSAKDIFFNVHLKWARNICWWTGYDNNTFYSLQRENFDIAVFETFFLCHHMIAYKLNLPYVSSSTFLSSVITRSHPLVTDMTYSIEGDRNTFFNRLKLFIQIHLADYAARFWAKNEDFGNIDNQPYPPLDQLVLKAELYLNNQNGIISYPTMSMPNVIKVGGLVNQEAKPLVGELREIMNSKMARDNGVIIVSFGSLFATLPTKLLLAMLAAFEKLNNLVVWRLKFRPGQENIVKLPPNVKIFDWLPQNDVLGHVNTKLFISHGGAVGLAEGIYNGVPMIGMGIQGDQPHNTQRMEQKGYGLNVDPKTLTSQSLLNHIRKIMKNYRSFKTVTEKAANIMKHLPNGRREAAFWIDHVMRFGSEHLRTKASDMPQYQILMIDIYAFFSAILLTFGAILFLIVRYCKVHLSRLVRQSYQLRVDTKLRVDSAFVEPSVNAMCMQSK